MRLLQLHLRNIASIEKADIDFEKEPGLMDPDTGQMARIFLIHGDTGTGKTVLLDAIAMALFGMTPRIEGVANKLRNTYLNASGNEISINSIEQYTRMGITDKDECYSEVLFEGNDAIRYRARMQLGVTRGNKNRKKWLLQVGDGPELEGKQCGEIIERAIGMNFAQFSRIAMLAQGQFATFLCGDREERADILEKLTNTSIFTRYGAAIKNIHDKKRSAAESAKSALDEAAKFLLNDEQREALTKQLAEANEALPAAKTLREAWEKIRSLLRMADERVSVLKKKEECECRRKPLAEMQAKATGQQKEAESAVATSQKEIDTLTSKLSSLKPDQLRTDHEAAEKLNLAYARLRDDYAACLAKADELKSKREALAALDKQKADTESIYREANEKYKHDKQNHELSLKRYTTLSASLDETLSNLRHQLGHDGNDTCPLCGQHIADVPISRDQFEALLSPLARERDEAAAVASKSQKEYNKARDAVNTLIGQMQHLGDEIQKLEKTIEDVQRKLSERMQKAGIASDGNIDAAITAKIEETDNTIQALRQRLKEADKLQADITELQRIQKPLVEAKGKADLAVKESELASRHNEERIKEYADRIGLIDKERHETLTACRPILEQYNLADGDDIPDQDTIVAELENARKRESSILSEAATAKSRLDTDDANRRRHERAKEAHDTAQATYAHWSVLNQRFGGDRFRNLVQTHILHPLLNNANVYLSHITERYSLTCSEENEQLSILVLDRYNRDEVRSAAVLSGGERFMISLALSLALSSLNRADMNVDILFIDEGFGTLDQTSLDSVMKTLGRLADLTGQSNRRVGIISHREELLDTIPNKIRLRRIGEGRSAVEVEAAGMPTA